MDEIMCDIGYSGIREMLKDCLCEIQAKASSLSMQGVPSGYCSLDDLTCGFENGKVYVIGGRPSMGKEEFMLSMIRNMIMEKVDVLLFSTNHMKRDYIYRLLSIHCNIPSLQLHKGYLETMEWERLDHEVDTLYDAPLYIHDAFDLPLNELVETARFCRRSSDLKIIFIDCLQMIDFAKENENPSERIARVMYSLKQLANFLNLPIVVGSMLNRDIECRKGLKGKRPHLMDLAKSSYIEEMADVVMMVHRPVYYGLYKDDGDRDLHGLMEICVMKNGLKPLGDIFLDYQWETGAVSMMKNERESCSKPTRQKELKTDNKALKSLGRASDLKEELPF